MAAGARGKLRNLAVALVTLAMLAACGGGGGPTRGTLAAPKPLDPAAHRATGIPAPFGDTRPHPWATIAPDLYAVHGIDAARYQGIIDWASARRAGVRFAWLKATEGGDHSDPGFAANAPGARAAGVPVGAYHFYYFCRTPAEQARWFIANVPRMAGDLPPVLDMEWNHHSRSCPHRPDPATIRAAITEYARIIARHYGTAPVIYTTPDFYADNDLGRLQGQEFWLRSVAGHPSERYPDERWTFWQYTGTGIVPGVGGIVDINAFAGSAANWPRWLAMRRQR